MIIVVNAHLFHASIIDCYINNGVRVVLTYSVMQKVVFEKPHAGASNP